MSTVLYLIRHAAHDQLGLTLTGRSGDVRLSAEGRKQAEALAVRLSAEALDALLTSPQPRTRETAEYVAKGRGVTVEVAEELDEIDFGPWAGKSFVELEADSAWNRWNAVRDEACTPAGETMRDVAGRLLRLTGCLRRRFPSGCVALVSHCDVIKAGICHYLGLPFGQMHRFEVDPASVSTIVVGDWGGKVLRLNETAPLPGGRA